MTEFAFVGELNEPKVFGGTSLSESSTEKALRNSLDRAVLAMRTFKTGQVGYNAIYFSAKGFLSLLRGTVTRTYRDEYVPSGSYHLSNEELQPFQQHAELVFAQLDPSLEVACSRLSLAQIRMDPRDRIIDAVIGLEAILLARRGEEAYRGEMRFRFAMNYIVLHESPDERQVQFNVAKSLYDLRSAIAHGGQVEECNISGENLNLAQAADKACIMLRSTVKLFLAGGERPAYAETGYWEKKCFGLGSA